MDESLKLELMNRSEMIELLEAYSKFLEEHGYTDTDWWAEEPTAINEFLKTIKTTNKTDYGKRKNSTDN
jgi:hypothetical protein